MNIRVRFRLEMTLFARATPKVSFSSRILPIIKSFDRWSPEVDIRARPACYQGLPKDFRALQEVSEQMTIFRARSRKERFICARIISICCRNEGRESQIAAGADVYWLMTGGRSAKSDYVAWLICSWCGFRYFVKNHSIVPVMISVACNAYISLDGVGGKQLG